MRLVVLGDPVEHSLSPLIHTRALAACSIAGTYEARRVDRSGMSKAADSIRTGELDGANVTMPHKRLAYELSDAVAPEAAATGAVNTLVRVAGEVIGHNTDVGGIRAAWGWGQLPDGVPVEIYGAGGAAAAAVVAVADRRVTVRARRREAAAELCATTGFGEPEAWGPPDAGAVVVNATPIGMHGDAFPSGWFDAAAGLFDMAYRAEATPAVVGATQRNIPVADGKDMLVAQAATSFWLWTGREAPVDALRAALRGAS